MRTFIFLSCFIAFSFTPDNVLSQNAKVEIDRDKIVTVDEVFEIIKEQTDYRFIYKSDLFTNFPKVHLKKGTIKASKLLKESLSSENFDFNFSSLNTVVITEKLTFSSIQKVVTGKVLDNVGLPMSGVTVMIKGTNRGVATNFDGAYSITVNTGQTLSFRYIGFSTQDVVVTDETEINITLKEDTSQLEEVVIVGYGQTKKRDLTGSVGTVKAEDLSKIKTQSIENALEGQISGVFVSPSTGEPGSGGSVHIRGLSQIKGDNQPLYVVDGVPIIVNPQMNNATGGDYGLSTFGTTVNPLLSIDPNNVERIDVLKDASAAAIYGSRAANGVILITTKRGKKGEVPRFSFSANTTIQNPINTLDYASASEWKGFMTTLAQFDLDNTTYPEDLWPIVLGNQYDIVNNPEDYFGTADTNWEELMTNKNAIWNQYNLSISGGSENVNYALSGSLNEQEGALILNKLKRYSYNFNIDAQVAAKIKAGGSINYNHSNNKSSGIEDLYGARFRPDQAVFGDDGDYTFTTGYWSDEYNPIGGEGRNKNKTIGKSMFGSVYGEIEIFKGVKFRSQINFSATDSHTENFVPSFNNGFQANAYNRPGATLVVQNNMGWSSSFVNTLNYNKSVNKHRIDAVLGASWDQSKLEFQQVTYRGFPDDTNLINTGSAFFVEFPESAHNQNGLNSLFGRINYTYDDRYLATFTARRDTSTKFGPGNQVGFFPSGALAWNLHNEDFLKDNSTIDQLKIRASLGQTGSDNLRSFSYLAYYNAGEFYAENPGMTIDALPNENIRWEQTNQLDLGLEFRMFNNRLNGEVVYFEKNTTGIILNVPVAAETGSGFWDTNIADVSNQGWEIMLGGDVIKSNNFRWNSSINIAFVSNNIDKLNGGSTDAGLNVGIKEGYPIGVINGWVVLDIAQSKEEIDALNAASPNGIYDPNLNLPGDYIMKDLDEDGMITSAGDREIIGDINPDYYGGWNNQMSYKNWDLGMNWTFAEGLKKDYEVISYGYISNAWNEGVTNLALTETWTPENKDAKYARFGSISNLKQNTRSVQDASFIKLRSASIGYNLPKSTLDKIGLSSAKLFITGNNLLTITEYDGLDPQDTRRAFSETYHQRSDDGSSYPNSRTFTMGLNVTF